MVPLRCLLFLLTLIAAAPAAFARKAPPWLEQAATTKVSVPVDEADAVVLLDEAVIEVERDGTLTTRSRWAVRILGGSGRDEAVARVHHAKDSTRIRSFKAWVIRPSGKVTELGKRDIVDVAIFGNALELYGEHREQRISAENKVEPGAVFGYETVVSGDTTYLQDVRAFQTSLPVERSSVTINHPAGWSVRGQVFNARGIEETATASGRTWTARGLRERKTDEPHAPAGSALAPWLAIDIEPPASGAGRKTRVAFSSWDGISTHFSPHYDIAASTDPALEARAQALVAGVPDNEERIRRLAEFSRRVNYISIALNIGEGGGMIPRAASRVLECNYGDCKDKATLLRALLKTQGIASYPVLLYAGDASHVQESWPSPSQFNHAILAIQIDESIEAPSVIEHPDLGRLLIFDPTDTHLPFGYLRPESSGAFAVLLAGDKGGLIRLPTVLSEHNRIQREVTARLYPDGYVHGSIREHFHGSASRPLRDEYRDRSATDYEALVQRWLGRNLPSPKLSNLAVNDDAPAGLFELTFDLDAQGVGKPMRDVLLVINPLLVSRRENTAFRDVRRTQPIAFKAYEFSERTELTLPEGYRIDEMMEPVALTAPFGRYTASARVDGSKLLVERTLQLEQATIPPEDYETVRTFFDKIHEAEHTPAVLERLQASARGTESSTP